jgi:hypothetical protein
MIRTLGQSKKQEMNIQPTKGSGDDIDLVQAYWRLVAVSDSSFLYELAGRFFCEQAGACRYYRLTLLRCVSHSLD